MSASSRRGCGVAVWLSCLLYALTSPDRACSQSVVTTADPPLPAALGFPLTLTCTVTATSNISEIQWSEDRVNGTSNEVDIDLSAGTSTLTIPIVLSADLGDYMCTATADDSVSHSIAVTAHVSMITMNFIPLTPPPFYTGTELMISCDVYVPQSVNEDSDLGLMMVVSYRQNGTALANNGKLSYTGLDDFGPSGDGTRLFRSAITISPLVLTTDLGQWTCQVEFNSTSNSLVLANSLSSDYSLHPVEVPTLTYSFPTASIDPTLVRVPDIYQQEVTFTCTGKVLRTLVVDKEIVWLVDDEETTTGVSPITDPKGTSSTSELQTLTQNVTGTRNYTCVVILAVVGDPVLQDAATAIVNVTSPASPNPPVSLATLNVVHDAATIVWVVTEIAYTNESYIVMYGMDMNNLTDSSTPVEGVADFSVMDQQLDTRIEGLKPNTKYYFTVLAINSVGNATSLQEMFTTVEIPPSISPSNFSVADKGSTYIQFSWDPPPSEFQNGEIVSYTLECISSLGLTPAATFPVTYLNDSFTSGGGVEDNITGFSPGAMYECSVQATNGAGDSPPATLNVTTIEEIPTGEPLNLAAFDEGSRKSSFSWDPPDLEKRLGVIVSYTITCVSARDGSVKTDTTDQSSVTLDGLSPDTMYNCTVNASNSVGAGPAAVVNFTTAMDKPDKTPKDFFAMSVQTDPKALMLAWRPVPEGNRNGMVTTYLYSCNSPQSKGGMIPTDPDLESANGMYSEVVSGLDPSTYYTCHVLARNVVGDGPAAEAMAMTAMSPESDSSSVVLVASVVTAIVLLITVLVVVLLIVVLFFRRYARGKSFDGSMTDEMIVLPEEKSNSVKNLDREYAEVPQYAEVESPTRMEERRKVIPKSMFSQHVKDMHEMRDKGFEYEYAMLPNDSKKDTCEVAKNAINRPKNKFANICPYDSSRVKLQYIDGQEGSDYINASYIDGYRCEDAYIAAQGPMPNTLTDFWRMVVEHRLSTIVMLTKCIEAGKRKCEQYWPENPREYKEFGHGKICVELVSITPYADFEMRKLVVTQPGLNEEPLEVIHWVFLGWPDHGVPKFATSLISFIRHVRREYKKSQTTSPMLVHCSAGVGRTGAFILLDYMLERLTKDDTINIHDFLVNMRSRRVLMVQTQAQYVFVHDALDEYITCGETDISIHMFKNTIAHLHKQIPGRDISGFESQFKLLEEVCRKPVHHECSDARQTYNEHKNRYPDRLPYDFGRVRLKVTGIQGADYINASFVDGYKSRDSYIATQGPLLSTITDFWRMIWERRSKCIVMLCRLDENSLESSASYWPDKVGEPQKQGNRLVVTLKNESVKKDYTVRTLELKEAKGVAVDVTHFHFTEWPEHTLPESCTGLLSMLDDVNKIQRTTGNRPITVMCNDGMGRTGTFICLHAQQERVKTEGVLDIFHFIKSARIQRPKLVTTLEQYIFCHEAIDKFLEMFELYCNFK